MSGNLSEARLPMKRRAARFGAATWCMVRGLGFRVKVEGLGFRVQGSGCRVQTSGLRVEG